MQEMVGIKGITYAGNHGLEIIHPDGSKFVHPLPGEMEERVGQLTEELEQECCQVSGESVSQCHSVTVSQCQGCVVTSLPVRTEPGWRTRGPC